MRDRDRVSCAVATADDLTRRIWSSSATQQSFAIAGELTANPNNIREMATSTVDGEDFEENSEALAIYEQSLTLRGAGWPKSTRATASGSATRPTSWSGLETSTVKLV